MRLSALRPPSHLLLPLRVLGLYLVIGGVFLKDYLLWDSQWLLAMALVPLVAQVQPQRSFSPGLLLAAAALAILAASLHNSTLYFFSFIVAVWCGAQGLIGRISPYPPLLLAVASPIFQYIAGIISFPLRLQLTDWAVQVLKAVRVEAEAAGNIILVNGEDFSVDPACAGIAMLSLSLLLAVFVLAHLQRTGQQWPLWAAALMLGLMLALNMFSNLLRILLLVVFKVLPTNPLHDIIGLLCLLFYALLPFCFLAKQAHQHLGKPKAKAVEATASLRGALLLNSLLLLLLTGTGMTVRQKQLLSLRQGAPQLSGFVKRS